MSTEVAAPAEAPAVLTRTTALDRRPVPPPGPGRHASPRPGVRAGPAGARSLLLLALLLVAGAGLGAWWFGWERYTSAPGVLGLMRERRPRRSSRRPASTYRSATRRTPRPSPRVGCSPPTPRPASRVLDGGTVTVVASRSARSATTSRRPRGMSEDEAQDALLDGHLAFGKAIGTLVGDGARRAPCCAATRRSARPCGPAPSSTCTSARDASRSTVTDWTGKDFVEARTALRAQGLRGQLHRGVLRHRRRAATSSRRRPTTAPCSAATRSPSWSRRAPSWSRCPDGLRASGVDVRDQATPRGARLPRRRSSTSPATSASVRLQRRPRVGHGPPEGVHRHPLAHLVS